MSRISSLPMRDPAPPGPALVEATTDWLRTAQGGEHLRPIQAQSLLELAECGGLFCAARVGAGKTLISALAPTVLGAAHPLLLVPAGLAAKTSRDFDGLRQHWRMPSATGYRIVSYQKLGRDSAADLLEDYAPDLVVCDESHWLKNRDGAACARRLHRYCLAHPECHAVFLSGTPSRTSIVDYAPQLGLALRAGAPVPSDPDLLDEWAAALDDHPKKDWIQPDLEALEVHLGPCPTQAAAQEAYHHRLTWTPGVVISTDGFDGVPCTIAPLHLPAPPALHEPFDRLRRLWVMPDDWPLSDESRGVWAAAQQLALGFYYYHDPRPPENWMTARREWCGYCRRVLESDQQEYDSELQVREACLTGRLPRRYWDAWAELKDTFIPVTYTSWLSSHALDAVAEWGTREPGSIVWSSHTAFSRELAARTGWRYFGEQGVDSTGLHVDQSTDPVIIVSARSSSEGRNLQWAYHRNLFLAPPGKSRDWEQRVGRTYRDGQAHPVHVDYLVACTEHWVAIGNAMAYAVGTAAREGQRHILLTAAVTSPPEDWLVGPAFA